jgi:hypothetical protein
MTQGGMGAVRILQRSRIQSWEACLGLEVAARLLTARVHCTGAAAFVSPCETSKETGTQLTNDGLCFAISRTHDAARSSTPTAICHAKW